MSHTIVIADDHPVVLQGLQSLLGQEPDFEVVAACRTGKEALAAIRQWQPVVAILDIRMPDRDGLSVLEDLVAEESPTRLVILTAVLDGSYSVASVARHAHGLLFKDAAPELLIDCLRAVLAGERWFDQNILELLPHRPAAEMIEREKLDAVLTPRELDIALLVAEGLPNKMIARRLSLAEGTIKVHLHNIFEKLGVGNRVELAILIQERHH